MPGAVPAFMMPGNYSEPAQQGGSGVVDPANGSHWGFIFWLIVLGVIVPAAILGGLKIGGFSFVFKHR